MYHFLTFLLLLCTAFTLGGAQTLPTTVQFPADDTLSWGIDVKMRVEISSSLKKQSQEVRAAFSVLADLFGFHDSGDTIVGFAKVREAQGRVKSAGGVTHRDTTFRKSTTGIEKYTLKCSFSRRGALLDLVLVDPLSSTEADSDYLALKEKFARNQNLHKTIFPGHDWGEGLKPGAEWKTIERDTSAFEGTLMVTERKLWWSYERAFDTLGRRVGVVWFAYDSMSIRTLDGREMVGMRLSSPPGANFGRLYVDLKTGQPVRTVGFGAVDTMLGPDVSQSDENKPKQTPQGKPLPSVTMKMRVEFDAGMTE